MEVIVVGALLAMVLTGLCKAYDDHRAGKRRMVALCEIACSVCQTEGVEERGGGSYRCLACGYDTDAVYPAPLKDSIQNLQELSIASSCLQRAAIDMGQSRHTVYHTTDHNHQEVRRTSGPHPERYLEGMEQSQEVIRLLVEPAEDSAPLREALLELGSIPAPPEHGRPLEFNRCVDQSVSCITRAQAIIGRAQWTATHTLKQTLRSA
jgi:hypothetical protein